MKSVDEHLTDVLGLVYPLSPLDLQLTEAHDCRLAEDVVAPWDLPLFDNSSMDGYAVRVGDVAEAREDGPVTLPVEGESAAGHPALSSVEPGRSARIMTGAPMPRGAEAVVPVEWTDGGVTQVTVRRPPVPGQYVRRRGEDVREGEVVLRAGDRLGPAQVGLLAAVGRATARVQPRPRVVVVSTGSELVEPGSELAAGQIADSNSYMLAAAAQEAGAQVYRVGIVPDDEDVLLATLEDQLIRADLVVTSGGVSAGAYDVVKGVLSRLGTVSFERVAMQPGMPQGSGRLGPEGTPILTLPGNPVSAFVSFELFVRPLLRRMLARESLYRPVVRAVCTEPLTSPSGKRQFQRGKLEPMPYGAEGDGPAYRVRPVGGAGSHLVGGLAQASALIVVPEQVTEVAAGEPVDVMVLERRET